MDEAQIKHLHSAKTPLFNCEKYAKPRTHYDMLWENCKG